MHRALSSRPLVASLSLLSRPPRPTMKRTLHEFFGSGPAVKQRRQALPDTEVATGTAVAAEPASHAETPSAKTAVELRTLANLNAALARRALAAGADSHVSVESVRYSRTQRSSASRWLSCAASAYRIKGQVSATKPRPECPATRSQTQLFTTQGLLRHWPPCSQRHPGSRS